MSWTSGVGRVCGILLDTIVRLLALSRINPNVLTLMGLVVNTYAAFLFGYANGNNQRRMFFYAGLVIIGSGFFDLVDGRVARASNQVTRFGGFFDSVVDRYSDASLFFGLHHRRLVQRDGAGAVGDCRAFNHHRSPPHYLHLAKDNGDGCTCPGGVNHTLK